MGRLFSLPPDDLVLSKHCIQLVLLYVIVIEGLTDRGRIYLRWTAFYERGLPCALFWQKYLLWNDVWEPAYAVIHLQTLFFRQIFFSNNGSEIVIIWLFYIRFTYQTKDNQ